MDATLNPEGLADALLPPIPPPAPVPPTLVPVEVFVLPPPVMRKPTAPIAELEREPQRFGFFQATRLIYQQRGVTARSLALDIGPIRWTTPQTLAFPPSEIDELKPLADAGKGAQAIGYSMKVAFIGLTGPSGMLPRHYTEWLIERRQSRDQVAQDFFDLFNQRVVAMFWRAWAKYRADIGLQFGLPNGVLQYVFDLVGMGTPSLRRRLFEAPEDSDGSQRRLPSRALAYYSGLISQRPHGIGSVSQVLGDFVGAKVDVEGCHGTWQAIPAADRTRLAKRTAALGDGCVLGTRVWDRQTTLQVRVGPLSWQKFHALLPGGALLADAVELARFLTGLSIDLRIRPAVAHDEVHATRFTRAADRPRLGWNTWLAGRTKRTPADECEFRFSAMGGASWQ